MFSGNCFTLVASPNHKKTIIMNKLYATVIMVAGASILSIQAMAIKFKVLGGSMDAVKNETQLNVVYDYSKMAVGKFDDEADYISKKKSDYNEKEAGRGESWAKAWKADRSKRFEPTFEELFNKHSEKTKVGSYPSAKYTLIFKTTFTEPGFNVHVMRKNASIDGEFWVVETANQGHVIAKVQMSDAPGRTFGGYDYDTGARIEECYAMAGKSFAKKYF